MSPGGIDIESQERVNRIPEAAQSILKPKLPSCESLFSPKAWMSEEAREWDRAQVCHPGPLTFHVTLRQNSREKQGFLRLDRRRPQGGQDTSFPLRPIEIGVILRFSLFILKSPRG